MHPNRNSIWGQMEIKYKDLSWPIKVAVVVSWIVGVIFAIGFLVGFIEGIMEVV